MKVGKGEKPLQIFPTWSGQYRIVMLDAGVRGGCVLKPTVESEGKKRVYAIRTSAGKDGEVFRSSQAVKVVRFPRGRI